MRRDRTWLKVLGLIACLEIVVATRSPAIAGFSISQCNQLAAAINKNPVLAPGIAYQAVACMIVSGRVTLTYVQTYDIEQEPATAEELSESQRKLTNFFCSDPKQKRLLSMVDIRYQWYDLRGVFLGAVIVRKEDC